MRFILLGAGDVGTTLASQLVDENHDVILIEKDEGKLANSLAGQLDIQTVHGNGCSPEILNRAGIATADYFIAVANNDEANIAACLISKLLNPDTKRIARIRDISLIHKDIEPAHISEYFDLIINPEQAAADYLFKMFKVAGAREVLDFCDSKLQVVAADVQEQSPYIGRRLSQMTELKTRLTMLIIAIIRDGELLIPRGTDYLQAEDTVYCVVPPGKVSLLFDMLGTHFTPAKSAMLVGAGGIARSLMHLLEDNGTSVKMVVPESDTSFELLDEVHSTLVLTGDGKDKDLLVEENVQDIDAFIAVTPDEEDNILASLLAKKLGARTAMALVNKSTYLPLVHAIGVDVVVSSRAAAANAIFSHIHAETVISEFAFRHLGAGFLEVLINKEISLVGKQISDIRIPEGVIFAAINRGEEIIIPGGTDKLLDKDKLVIFYTKGVERKLEKLLGKKIDLLHHR
jgi:trk system potassium uptake protein TrkA